MPVRRAARLLALALAQVLAGCGQPAPKPPPPAPAIWQVTTPGGQQGWLFGTIHALPDGYDWRTPQVTQALDQSGVLVFEVANLQDSAAAAREFAARSTSPGLPPILARVPATDRAALAEALDNADIAPASLARTESWAAALLLANAAADGLDSANGVDRALLAQGRPVIGLESFARQFDLFDRLTPQDQSVLLVEAARETDGADEETELARAWLRGDIARLEREDKTGILADPELRAALLVGRNRDWAARIAPLLDQGRRPFVAVGAGHMLGPDGLPALLAARGYRVERLR
ncbi:MAG: TraB/GumN family protein [Croceibacterium sp.]